MSPLLPSRSPSRCCARWCHRYRLYPGHCTRAKPVDSGTGRRHDRGMKRMSLRKFGRIVARVLKTLPQEITRHMHNVVVDVEEESSEQDLREAGFTEEEIEEGDSLYGLFVPMPLVNLDYGDFLDEPH